MEEKRKLNVALIGTRGVPANYGGFETCVEELGRRLAERGHSVTVYCRESYYLRKQENYLGMSLVYLPNSRRKALDTLSHTFLSVWHALRRPYDVYMVFNAANSPALLPARLLGKNIAINTDGLEWKRGKWGGAGRTYYQAAEWLSTKIADRIVADSRGIQDYYRRRYRTDSTLIAYGAYPQESRKPELLESFGLCPGEYFLQITRFEPENHPLLTVEAFNRLKTDKKLVLVGGVRYGSDYFPELKAAAGGRVLLPGFIYDKDLFKELWCNCYAYIHGNEVGGTNPALTRPWLVAALLWRSMSLSAMMFWRIVASSFARTPMTWRKRWPGRSIIVMNWRNSRIRRGSGSASAIRGRGVRKSMKN